MGLLDSFAGGAAANEATKGHDAKGQKPGGLGSGKWHGIPAWLLLVGGAVGAYLLYRWYENRNASSAAAATATPASTGAPVSGQGGGAGWGSGGGGSQNSAGGQNAWRWANNGSAGLASAAGAGSVMTAPSSVSAGTATASYPNPAATVAQVVTPNIATAASNPGGTVVTVPNYPGYSGGGLPVGPGSAVPNPTPVTITNPAALAAGQANIFNGSPTTPAQQQALQTFANASQTSHPVATGSNPIPVTPSSAVATNTLSALNPNNFQPAQAPSPAVQASAAKNVATPQKAQNAAGANTSGVGVHY